MMGASEEAKQQQPAAAAATEPAVVVVVDEEKLPPIEPRAEPVLAATGTGRQEAASAQVRDGDGDGDDPQSKQPNLLLLLHHRYSAPAWTERLRRRWVYLALWQKLAVIAVPLLLILALILGLALGLRGGSGRGQNLPLPSDHGGPYTGDLTYYEPGLGACGITSSSNEKIVAISHRLFDAAQTGSDPNANPLCGTKIRAKRYKEGVGERSVDLTVVDRCVGCAATDIDVTTSAFRELADLDLGRVTVSWSWLG